MSKGFSYSMTLEVISEGFDGKTEWFSPRAGIIPPQTAVLTVVKSLLGDSDVFLSVASCYSENLGHTWSKLICHENSLGRRLEPDGIEVTFCDITPMWHAATGKLLATGHTARYKNGKLIPKLRRRETAYAVYHPATHTWSAWAVMEMPDPEDKFFSCGAGCTQRVDLDNGQILLPVYFMPRKEASDPWRHCYRTTVVRCRFDGQVLKYIEHGDELTVPEPRGLAEPSLICFQGTFFLTLRNDLRGYVTRGSDGLHFEPPIPWCFDDGQELGSYNTQQHWLTLGNKLFLSYTRKGAGNDDVFRHRAPLFLAEVDPERLCVLKQTERLIVPNKGAQLGNFGTVQVSPEESWVLTSEGMQGDARQPYDIQRTISRGANNRIYLVRLHSVNSA